MLFEQIDGSSSSSGMLYEAGSSAPCSSGSDEGPNFTWSHCHSGSESVDNEVVPGHEYPIYARVS